MWNKYLFRDDLNAESSGYVKLGDPVAEEGELETEEGDDEETS